MTSPRAPYFSVIEPVINNEIEPIKSSRFIGYLYHVDNNESALEIIKTVTANHPHARHFCYAYQLYTDKRKRFSDDGEPAGSAGKPILNHIIGYPLYDVLIIIVRYFGGVKLGVGGLVRAYSQACKSCIEQAKIITITPTISINIVHDYDLTPTINSALAKLKLIAINHIYAENVSLTIKVADKDIDEFLEIFNEIGAGASNGKLQITMTK